MKKFIYALTIAVVLFSFGANLAESNDKEIILTQHQKNFATSMMDEVGYLKAEWENSYVLKITMDPVMSSITTKSQAKQYAILNAAEGYLYTGKNICVKIIDPERGELAYECAGEHSDT